MISAGRASVTISASLRQKRRRSAGGTATVCTRSGEPAGAYTIFTALAPRLRRSEEHTSELQSRLHLVCRLLLEKKKTTKHNDTADTKALKLALGQHHTIVAIT